MRLLCFISILLRISSDVHADENCTPFDLKPKGTGCHQEFEQCSFVGVSWVFTKKVCRHSSIEDCCFDAEVQQCVCHKKKVSDQDKNLFDYDSNALPEDPGSGEMNELALDMTKNKPWWIEGRISRDFTIETSETPWWEQDEETDGSQKSSGPPEGQGYPLSEETR